MPKEKYSRGPEIFAHCKAIAEKFDLYRDACLSDRGDGDALGRRDPGAGWSRPNRGDAMKARFVCLANGLLQRPKLPGIPGIETFEGTPFHTSRWDYDYTGGDSDRQPDGAPRTSAWDHRHRALPPVQCVPHLARACPSTSTSSSAPRRPSTCATTSRRSGMGRQPRARLAPEERMDNFQILTAGGYQEEDLVNDGWTDIIRKLLFVMQSDEPTPTFAGRPGEEPGAGRLHEDGGDPRARGLHRRRPGPPPRRSSPTTGSSASARASTTSTCRPSTPQRHASSTPRRRVSSG